MQDRVSRMYLETLATVIHHCHADGPGGSRMSSNPSMADFLGSNRIILRHPHCLKVDALDPLLSIVSTGGGEFVAYDSFPRPSFGLLDQETRYIQWPLRVLLYSHRKPMGVHDHRMLHRRPWRSVEELRLLIHERLRGGRGEPRPN